MLVVDDDYVSVAKAAELLNVSRSTLWRWIEAEKVPAYRRVLNQARLLGRAYHSVEGRKRTGDGKQRA